MNFWRLFGSNALELDRSALVVQLRDAVAEVKLNLVLLMDPVKSQLYHYLPKGGIPSCFFDSDWSPDDVDDLSWITLLVTFLTHFSQGKWNAEAFLSSIMLLLLLFRDSFLLKRVHDVVLGHIDKHLASRVNILCLDYEAFGRLNYHSAVLVHLRLASVLL